MLPSSYRCYKIKCQHAWSIFGACSWSIPRPCGLRDFQVRGAVLRCRSTGVPHSFQASIVRAFVLPITIARECNVAERDSKQSHRRQKRSHVERTRLSDDSARLDSVQTWQCYMYMQRQLQARNLTHLHNEALAAISGCMKSSPNCQLYWPFPCDGRMSSIVQPYHLRHVGISPQFQTSWAQSRQATKLGLLALHLVRAAKDGRSHSIGRRKEPWRFFSRTRGDTLPREEASSRNFVLNFKEFSPILDNTYSEPVLRGATSIERFVVKLIFSTKFQACLAREFRHAPLPLEDNILVFCQRLNALDVEKRVVEMRSNSPTIGMSAAG